MKIERKKDTLSYAGIVFGVFIVFLPVLLVLVLPKSFFSVFDFSSFLFIIVAAIGGYLFGKMKNVFSKVGKETIAEIKKGKLYIPFYLTVVGVSKVYISEIERIRIEKLYEGDWYDRHYPFTFVLKDGKSKTLRVRENEKDLVTRFILENLPGVRISSIQSGSEQDIDFS